MRLTKDNIDELENAKEGEAVSVSMHPLVRGINPSQWNKLSRDRRKFENRRAVLAFQREQAKQSAKAGIQPQFDEVMEQSLRKETL